MFTRILVCFRRLLTSENVWGVVEMAHADTPALVPGTEPPRRPCPSALSAPLSPSEGARWCVPVQCVQWQTYLAKWAAQRAWWKLHVGIPRMLIFREQRYFMTSKLQVLLFILIFMALPAACTKIERRQAMVIVSVEMASHPHTHSQHKHVSKYSHGLRLSP